VSDSPVHFLTFTGNALAETTFEYATWGAGRTQRAVASSFQMGGKGINVSKMLRRLGGHTTAMAFLGGPTGLQCSAWLEAAGMPHLAFRSTGQTRSGLVVRSPGQPETTFLGPDSPPDAQAWEDASKTLTRLGREAVQGGVVLAFCGSCPGWATEEAAPFRGAIEAWLAAGHPLYVDSYGPPLAWFAGKSVDLIKINADEMRGLLGAEGAIDELLRLALATFPVKAWIVSDGPGPVWYAAQGETPRFQTPPVVKELSATGSGDVLLASLLHARLAKGASWDEAIRFALPLASANAAHPGIAEFELG
jgi:fructose-1-phosphate kinase PfkB-like protein